MKLAITGATGFVGSAIVRLALSEGHQVRALVRRRGSLPSSVEIVETGDLLRTEVAPAMLAGCDALINCAARVHVTRERERDADAAYRAANCDLPLKLLAVAADAGIRRFVQLSSVAAVMSHTPPGRVVDDSDVPRPASPYGRSKLEADLRLQDLARERHVSFVSVRPPTVFGPGVGAYVKMLMRTAKLGVPLPIGAIRNRRSFMFIGNLAAAVLRAARESGEGCFIVTDSPPVSTADVYRDLLRLCHRPARVPALPAGVVRNLASLILGERAESLLGNAAYDGTRFARTFNWSPEVSPAEALSMTVAAA
jgi:UDP-glucose 4-epimerase